VRKTLLFEPFLRSKRSIHQDRLGTNDETLEKRDAFSHREPQPRAIAQAHARKQRCQRSISRRSGACGRRSCAVRKQFWGNCSYKKSSRYQDRLGTDTGKPHKKQTPFARRLSSLTSPLTGAEYVNQSGGVNPLYDTNLISPKTSTVSAFPGDVRLSQACLGKWLRFVAWDHSKSD
jgi:hypothetical protein